MNLGPYWTDYTNYFFSSQPLNYARTYEVTADSLNSSSFWTVHIANQTRDSFGPYITPTPQVSAFAELSDTRDQDWASFNNVQYRGQYTYIPFDQNHEQQDRPPWGTFPSYHSFTCSNPQNY